LETFKEMCELYTMYGFPYSYSFVNRFRTGEMPVAVAGYITYSQLTIYAPELRGLWGFTILPGTVRTDANGNTFVDHTADTNVTGIVMMRGCEEIEAAWNFMKWWVSTDTQATYGQEYYALLGASGQYATANMEALYSMSWTADERAELHKQFEWLQATPEMPGGYIITRYVNFAFLAAYNEDANPVEEMLSYIDVINAELSRKREEFNLPTLEDFKKS
jgi:ABC-type glycerol-3-phosphate transport system substrate-binding protein